MDEALAECEEVETTITAEEDTPLGFSAQDVLDFAAGSRAATFTYEGGATTDLTLDVGYDAGALRFVDAEPPEDLEIEIGLECPDRVEIEVTIGLSTADGGFDESLPNVLRAFEATTASFSFADELGNFSGTHDFEADLDAAGVDDYDRAAVYVDGALEGGPSEHTAGDVFVQASGEDGDGDEGTAWATEVAVGSWSSPGE